MTDESAETQPGTIDLRSARRITLAALAACGLITFSQGVETRPETDPVATALAIALGLLCIVLRRLAQGRKTERRSADLLACACLGAAVGLGLLGVWTALRHNAGQTGLLFVTAGVLFAIRPLRPIDRD